jgi:hypothetical protein
MFRRTLETEFCLKTIDPVSLWGLGVKFDAPLSLYEGATNPQLLAYFKGERTVIK